MKTVMTLRGQGKPDDGVVRVVAHSDVAYNNPVKGRSFCQPGTQAWAPCFAGEPGLEHIPIAFQTRSKVCSCPCDSVHKKGCTKTFSSMQAMGNAEYDLGKDLAKELMEGESPLGVSSLVTDGDSHLHKGMEEVMKVFGIKTQKGDCTRHITKSVSRNIAKANLRCFKETKTQQERQRKQRCLAGFIERRCTMEFRAAYKIHGGDLEKMKNACHLAKIGILGCIQGHPDVCRQSSLVCGAHRWKSGNKVRYSELH